MTSCCSHKSICERWLDIQLTLSLSRFIQTTAVIVDVFDAGLFTFTKRGTKFIIRKERRKEGGWEERLGWGGGEMYDGFIIMHPRWKIGSMLKGGEREYNEKRTVNRKRKEEEGKKHGDCFRPYLLLWELCYYSPHLFFLSFAACLLLLFQSRAMLLLLFGPKRKSE